MVYASKPHSYRELPIRAGEIGLRLPLRVLRTLHGIEPLPL